MNEGMNAIVIKRLNEHESGKSCELTAMKKDDKIAVLKFTSDRQ